MVIPFTLGGVSLGVLILWKAFDLPERDVFVDLVKHYFSVYGAWIVFVSALLEGMLVAGSFFPGGVVIFLGVATAWDARRAAFVVVVVSVAFFIAYTIDYFLGKYGWYRLFLKFGLKEPIEKSKAKLSRHEPTAIVFSYWSPNLAAITATAAGVLRIPLKRFLRHSAIGIIVWNTFWGILVFSLGERALNLISVKWAALILGSWVIIILLKHHFYDKKNPPTAESVIELI